MKQASTRASDNYPEPHLAYFEHNACHADHAVGGLEMFKLRKSLQYDA